ncbi:MAG TPA: formyltransferase family protein, partial [Candidatus Deferrimicrobiaceae bacterium]|nr:formyltransferase family protein [Candidatus Deferrimicrobiaceae bacterium]
LPALGILKVHPSILPRHRGAAPIQATIADGDARAGVSIIVMDEGVDTGPILAVTDWPLAGTERAPDLERRAATTGAALLGQVLGSWLDRSAIPEPQEVARASTTRPLQREDGRLDPGHPAEELERRVRAYDPWPGGFIETDAGRILVVASSVVPSQPDDVPGMLVEHEGRLALATHHGRLVLEVAQREGRDPTPGEDFLRGQRRLVGSLVKPAPRDGGR